MGIPNCKPWLMVKGPVPASLISHISSRALREGHPLCCAGNLGSGSGTGTGTGGVSSL